MLPEVTGSEEKDIRARSPEPERGRKRVNSGLATSMHRSHSTDTSFKPNKEGQDFENLPVHCKVAESDGKIWNANQFLESVILRREHTKHMVANLPCLSYSSETELVILLTGLKKLDDFTKSRLLSLVDAAEALSPACQKLVFIAERKTQHYNDLKKMLGVIGAKRMSADEMAAFVLDGESESKDFKKAFNSAFLESYGFFAMEI